MRKAHAAPVAYLGKRSKKQFVALPQAVAAFFPARFLTCWPHTYELTSDECGTSHFFRGDTEMFLSILRWTQIFAKRPRLTAFVFGLWVLLRVFPGTQAMAQQNVVVVRPKEIHDVLVNPSEVQWARTESTTQVV
jgi:hypothetical protein